MQTVFLSLVCSILGQIKAEWVVWVSSLLLEVLQWDWMCVAAVKIYTWNVVKNPAPPWNMQPQTTFVNTYMKTWNWRKVLWVPTSGSLLLGRGVWWGAAAHLGAEKEQRGLCILGMVAAHLPWHTRPGLSLTPVLSKKEKKNMLPTSILTTWHFAEPG